MVVIGSGRGEMGSQCLLGTALQFGKMRKFWSLPSTPAPMCFPDHLQHQVGGWPIIRFDSDTYLPGVRSDSTR